MHRSPRHLLELDDLTNGELQRVIELSRQEPNANLMKQKSAALLFEKPSSRTRHSTELAVKELGGFPISVRKEEVSIGGRESIGDVALTFSCYHSIIGARVFNHAVLVEMCKAIDDAGANTSVMNLLSDLAHPFQAVADLITILDELKCDFDSLKDLKITYVGDPNNVFNSLAICLSHFKTPINIASPPGFSPDKKVVPKVNKLGGRVFEISDPVEAVKGADVIYTDTWVSMGQEQDAQIKSERFKDYQVNGKLLENAKSTAIVLHCLPAHRGEEITDEVIDGSSSRVWKQARNREKAAMGIISFLIESQGGRTWP